MESRVEFKDLKAKSGQQYLNELRGRLRFDIGKHKDKKLKQALGSIARSTILNNSVSDTHALRLEKQFLARWGSLTKAEVLQRLRFWTVLDSISFLDVDSIISSVHDMKARLKAVCEKVRGIEVIGVCEIEIINFEKMRHLSQTADEARKLNTLLELLPAEERSLFKTDATTFALIHFHGIVDLQNYSEDKEDAFIKASKKRWSEPYAVELKKLYSTNSPRKNFSRIAKYLVKGGNENLIYKIGYGYDTEDAINRHLIKRGKATADADFDGFENELSLTIKEIEVLGQSIHTLMLSSSSKNMKNGYLFRHGYQKR